MVKKRTSLLYNYQKGKSKICTSAKTDLNVWNHKRQKRWQSWNVLSWKHRGLMACECSEEQGETLWEIQQKKHKMFSLPAHACHHNLNLLIFFQVFWKALASRSLTNNNSHPRNQHILGRSCFNSKANWTRVRYSLCPSSSWQQLLGKLILKVPQYLRQMKKSSTNKP